MKLPDILPFLAAILRPVFTHTVYPPENDRLEAQARDPYLPYKDKTPTETTSSRPMPTKMPPSQPTSVSQRPSSSSPILRKR